MKKITLLTLLIGVSAFAQIDNYTDYLTQDIPQVVASKNATVVTRLDNSRQAILGTFTDENAFLDEYNATCPSGELIFEDFLNGPVNITDCGPVISAAGDGCYAAGEIQTGIEITANAGANTVSIPVMAIGNTDALAGAITFANFTILTFTEETLAVGMTLFNNLDPDIDFRVFGEDGTLLDSFIVTNDINTENFFGVIAEEPISSIEIEGANDSGELLGQLQFGACTLAVDEVLSEQFSVFPNPAQNSITINNRSVNPVTDAVLYDILGKDTGMRLEGDVMNISSLATGIYYLSINTPQGSLVQKIIKQ